MTGVAFFAICLCSCQPRFSDVPQTSGVEPETVLLITVDTLRADHLSAYGYSLPTSLAIDRLATGGIRFAKAFSGSACTAPATASIMVGRYPSFHTVGVLNGLYQFNPFELTLAEVMSANGYRTGAIVGNPVLRAEVGFDQGFETYNDKMEGRELNRPKTGERRSDRVVDLAIDWLEVADARPSFLWLHFQDPHGPYAPPEGWDPFRGAEYDQPGAMLPLGVDQSGYGAIPKYQVLGEERRIAEYVRRYDSEIAFFDDQLNRLMTYLSDRGLLDSTLVVFTADHGEAFGEDGFYFGHSHSVGPDQVSVPLLVVGPGVPRGRVVRAPVSNVSVMASILDLVGIEAPEGLVGPSLAGLFGDPGEDVAPVFFETPNQSGVVHGNVFLRHDRHAVDDEAFWAAGNPNTGGYWRPLGREVIAPLDPGVGHKNLSSEVELDELLVDFDQDARRARAELEDQRVLVPLPESVLDRLRALGYVQ